MKSILPAFCLLLIACLAPGFVTVQENTEVLNAAEQPATDVIPPIYQRFAAEKVEEVPDFQKHVSPMLGRLGCNGRACHGSFQGQGGFRLSLFGYDFKMDHDGLNERLDKNDPAGSYLVEKATNKDEHKGGQVVKPGSWQHHVFLKWIASGAPGLKNDNTTKLVKLEVTPREFIFNSASQKKQLKAVAVWEDGSKEDVTALCRFQSNDTAIASIDADGLVTSGDMGDTHVVAFYDTAVVPIPVLRPVSDQIGKNYPEVATPTKIDELVVNKLRKLGIVPSEVCNDAEFLRRVSLDMIGTLPTPSEVTAFLSDTTADKRSRKIDELLSRPAYAAWWTTKFCDITGNNSNFLQNASVDRNKSGQEWYDWIYKRINENTPYDKIVESIVLANSIQSGESYKDYCDYMSKCYSEPNKFNYADREGLTYYWARRNFRTPEERAIGFAYAFMGIKIECAQCHKHPFDQWTQDDFVQFQGFFSHTTTVQTKPSDPTFQELVKGLDIDGLKGNDLQRKLYTYLKDGKSVPFPYVATRQAKAPPKNPKAKESKKPDKRVLQTSVATVLGGEEYDLTKFEDPREPLMNWLKTEKTHYMARAIVNRIWAGYFNRGIVQPTDDHSLANPPSNAELLSYLTEGFVQNNYDLKWVHREIANSATYQSSWKTNSTNVLDERNFSHSIPRRLPAEVAVDAVKFATASSEALSQLQNNIDKRSIAVASTDRNGNQYSLTVFGRPIRESNCDCERTMEPSLLQTIYLRNDAEVFDNINRRNSSWLDEIAKSMNLKNTYNAATPAVGGKDREKARMDGNIKEIDALISKLKVRLEKAKTAKDEATIKSVKKQLEQQQDRRAKLLQTLKGKPDVADNTEDKKTGDDAAQSANKWKQETADQIVNDAYLRTLSRFPTAEEKQDAIAFLQKQPSELEGLEGLMWALINTKEFIVNH